MTDDRSAALLVRVWLESGTDQFRARVIATAPDTGEEDRTVALASSPREVADAISDWLDRFIQHGTTTG